MKVTAQTEWLCYIPRKGYMCWNVDVGGLQNGATAQHVFLFRRFAHSAWPGLKHNMGPHKATNGVHGPEMDARGRQRAPDA